MIRSINDVTRLNNGILMPWFGLGVWKAEGQEVVDAVKWAVQAGYRHIDTAAVYGNEKEVGIGLKECGVDRLCRPVPHPLAAPGDGRHLPRDVDGNGAHL